MESLTLKEIIEESILELIEKDYVLLEKRVNERCICSHLANYIEKRFEKNQYDWNIDVEYNRNFQKPKSLMFDKTIKKVIPDIIIHRRDKNNNMFEGMDNNLLIIEVKQFAKEKGKEQDIKKINAFIQEAPYRYKYGLFLNFTNFAPWSECTWFERE